MSEKKKRSPTKKQTASKRPAKSKKPATTRGGTKNRRPPKPTPSPGRLRPATRPPIKLPQLPTQWPFDLRRQAIITGLVMTFVTLLLFLSLFSPNRGRLPAAVLDGLGTLFGWGGLVVLLLVFLVGFWLVGWGMRKPLPLPTTRLAGAGALFLVLEALASIIALVRPNGLADFAAVQAAGVGGGWMGNLLAQALMGIAGTFGAIFLLLLLGLVAGGVASGIGREDLLSWWQQVRRETPSAPPEPTTTMPAQAPEPAAVPAPPVADTAEEEVQPWVEPPTPPSRPAKKKKRPTPAKPSPPQPLIPSRDEPQKRSWALPAVADILNVGEDRDLSDTTVREQQQLIVETLNSFGAPARVVEINKGPTIIQYGVEPLYIVQRNGKRTKVKVGKIASLADDLALALAARSVRIQAPVPGKGYVGIEVPNEAKTLVSLRDVMESAAFGQMAQKSPLTIGLGQDVSGQPMVIDLTKMPHMLVAGATGSGKSVCVNAIITCLLLQNSPEELQLVMVDPKRVELTGYNGIPHLAAPVVVDMERVVGTLQWALREMDNRYRLFAELGARHIIDYNRKIRSKKENKLPYVVIIIDELADLMMLAPEDTERGVTRLAQMARATGIHMIIATQRPSVDVVTGLIKANFPARIAFAVASSTDSRVVLDTTGAERLLGQGDMLFQAPDKPAPVRMQGCFVSDDELNKLIDYWKHARRFGHIERQRNFIRAMAERVSKRELDQAVWDVDEDPHKMVKMAPKKDAQANGVAAEPTAEAAATTKKQPYLWNELQEEIEAAQAEAMTPAHPVDEMYPQAVELVRELGKASTSLLQRRFRIGYTRAARLIDVMEEQGVIGPPTGTSKAREVLPLPTGDDESA